MRTASTMPEASESVSEGALEANIPILQGKPFADNYSVDLAGRYTHYAISGNYLTWKVGLDMRFNRTVTFRATDSRDIRAPSLYEL